MPSTEWDRRWDIPRRGSRVPECSAGIGRHADWSISTHPPHNAPKCLRQPGAPVNHNSGVVTPPPLRGVQLRQRWLPLRWDTFDHLNSPLTASPTDFRSRNDGRTRLTSPTPWLFAPPQLWPELKSTSSLAACAFRPSTAPALGYGLGTAPSLDAPRASPTRADSSFGSGSWALDGSRFLPDRSTSICEGEGEAELSAVTHEWEKTADGISDRPPVQAEHE